MGFAIALPILRLPILRVVATMQGDEIPQIQGMAKLADWIAQNWIERGEKIISRSDTGDIHIDRKSVKDSAAHGLGKAKVQAFYLIPDALRNGRLLGELPQQDNKPKAFIIAAPVKIGDSIFKMYMEVRHDANLKRLYMHEVVLQGSPTPAFKTSAANLNDAEPQGAKRRAIFSFIQNLRNVNTSKVVDENGEPLVVYHSTDADFSEFKRIFGSDIGFHFGDTQAANDRMAYKEKTGLSVISVFLNIKNPIEAIDIGGFTYAPANLADAFASSEIKARTGKAN
jgi:hypothetical protein